MKSRRHARILKLIESNCVETQEELTRLLREDGFNVTQATVSRDIKDLRLIKVADGEGNTKYVGSYDNSGNNYNRLLKVFSQAFVSADYAVNLVVVRTLSGMANAVASAIDATNYQNVLGTIAGDDNVIVICRSEEYANKLVEQFNKLSVSD